MGSDLNCAMILVSGNQKLGDVFQGKLMKMMEIWHLLHFVTGRSLIVLGIIVQTKARAVKALLRKRPIFSVMKAKPAYQMVNSNPY